MRCKAVIAVLAFACAPLACGSRDAAVPPAAPTPAPVIPAGDVCNLYPQHGLADLRCEPRDAPAPGDTFMQEDFCRPLVSCELIGDNCELIATPAFDECRDCFARCQNSECVTACSRLAQTLVAGE